MSAARGEYLFAAEAFITTHLDEKSLLILREEGGLGSGTDALEKRAHLRRLSGGSGCDNDTVIVSRLHRCIAETTASTAAALSTQPTTYFVNVNTFDSPINRSHCFF